MVGGRDHSGCRIGKLGWPWVASRTSSVPSRGGSCCNCTRSMSRDCCERELSGSEFASERRTPQRRMSFSPAVCSGGGVVPMNKLKDNCVRKV